MKMALGEGIASLHKVLASLDFFTAEEEYKKFIKFIQNLQDPIRSHAASFLYPFFVYIYIYLLAEEQITDAQKFFTAYKSLFTKADGYSKAVQCLSNLRTLQSVKENSYFKKFCESKYVVKVSEDSLKCLLLFFQELQSKWLSTVLYTHLYVEDINLKGSQNEKTISKNEDKDIKCSESKIEQVQKAADRNIKSSQREVEISKQEVKDIKFSESKTEQFQKAADTNIKSSQDKVEISEDQVRSVEVSQPKTIPLLKLPTCPTGTSLKKISSYLFLIDENLDSVCCAAFSKSNALACGYFNSAVKLWTSVLDSDSESEYSSLNNDSEESQTPELETKTIQCSNPDKVLHGHDGAVFGTAFPHKWDLLMTCSEDTTVKAWDMKSYENVATYYEHKYPVFDIDISYDSAYFATASEDTTACLWSFERSSAVRIFAGHSSDVDCVRFHSNGRYIASASLDKSIILWTVQDARSVRHFTGHDAYISCIAFSPNGYQLASADDSGCIKIWDLGSGKKISEVKAHDSRILCLNFNRSGTCLASGGFDNYLKVWDAQSCLNHNKSQSEASGSFEDPPHIGLFDSHHSESTFHHLHFSKNNFLFSVTTHSEMKHTDT